MWRTILQWLLTKCEFQLYTSTAPIGRRLGGADIPDLPDTYICLRITLAGFDVLTGHFQKS